MLFNFFNSKKQIEQQKDDEESVLGSITYFIKKNDDNIIIDIQMQDYENESLLAISKLIDIISEDACYIETVNILKTSLIEDGSAHLLVPILSHIGENARLKLINNQKESVKDEPCVKPSDMLR